MLNVEYMSDRYWNFDSSYQKWLREVTLDSQAWDVHPANNNRAGYYLNIPASFDIETTSFYEQDNKRASMYVWMLGINGINIIGRHWSEWLKVLEDIDTILQEKGATLIIYVHNLAYEFQWIRKMIQWDKVFSVKPRKPVYACAGLFEFRCSYLLTGMSLERSALQLTREELIKFQKQTGKLDYNLPRHSSTKLTSTEKEYCLGDINAVQAIIYEKILNEGGIENIPITNTGYVRKYCRECCLPAEDEKQRLTYRELMNSLQINSVDEFSQLKRAFMGGFTHASSLWSGKTITSKASSFKSDSYYEDGVGSMDITSSYPYTMVCLYFPMTPWKQVEIRDNNAFYYYLDRFCCLFDVEFEDLRPQIITENPLSSSRCWIEGNSTLNNGRVVSAEKCRTTLCELDWKTMLEFYTWSSIKITNFRYSSRGRLPRELIMAILKFYQDKTLLKNVEGKEAEYLLAKGMLNSSFGMMVTSIIRDEIVYDVSEEHWAKISANTVAELSQYNNNFNRFLNYSWGVWVTAHARRRLFEAIKEFGVDYVYSDTDSVKGVNFENHREWISKENKKVVENIIKTSEYYDIPLQMFNPSDVKGINHTLGVWEIEEGYASFKTVGAKRYLYELPDGNLNLTVSGLNKKVAIPWLLEKCHGVHEFVFDLFGEGLYVEAGHTGKLTSSYIDDETLGTLVDYKGVPAQYHELSSVHLEPQGYYMSMNYEYAQFLVGIQEDYK